MAYDDLRSFLDVLDKNGQLLHITEELLPEPDLAAADEATGLDRLRELTRSTPRDHAERTTTVICPRCAYERIDNAPEVPTVPPLIGLKEQHAAAVR